MHSSEYWQRFFGMIESGDLDDLRQDMILEIGAAAFAIGWILTVSAIGYEGQMGYLLPALVLLAGAVFCIWVRQAHPKIAIYGMIAILLAAVTALKLGLPASHAQFFFPLVVVVSSLLVPNLRTFAVAAIASAACLGVARMQGAGWSDPLESTTPVALILMTAFAGWLGSRQVHMALSWMHTSYRRAEGLVEELRQERMIQARALKALEEAYVRIEKMNYALIEARSAADEARRLKAEFAANVSHELRTPLNIIIGFSETMANAPETYPNVSWSSTLRGDIEQIYQNARHLSSLIDDILDLSALEINRLGLVMKEAHITEVIEEAAATVKDLYRAKNLYLNIEAEPDLPQLRVDPTRIRQVLINLLTNASRFTKEGGVTIKIQQVDHEIRVAVCDTGIGIAPKDIARVFEDFGQVDGSASRKHEGTGLGVPLSKRLVELHGGRMWLESEVGRGSTFYFSLPVGGRVEPQARGAYPGSPASSRAYQKPVLMLEPDPMLLRTVRRHLSGHDVIGFTRKEELAGLLEHHHPAALVIDQDEHEPIETGQQAIPPDLPVISVSMPSSLRVAQSLQIENYLIKPVLREQLIEAIRELNGEVSEILVVDDDPQLVELISRMLQSAGKEYHLHEAYSGVQALNWLREGRPVDVVLLDLIMPEVSGLEVLREMKADPLLASIPVIVISAQYPDTLAPEGELRMELRRSKNASLSEMLSYLRALVSAVPMRDLPGGAAAPGLREAQGGRPAS